VNATYNKKHGNLKSIKAKCHVIMAQDPTKNNDERNDEESDLHRGADGDSNCEIHLILDGYGNGSGMFCGISNDGYKN
jgi:hypothetical protein